MRKLRKTCLKEGDFKGAGILDMVAQGAAWPPSRRAAIGAGVSPLCEFCCKESEGTIRHQVWCCPKILAGIGGVREETKHLEEPARAASSVDEPAARRRWAAGVPPAECEAFWLRGILPKAGTGPLRDLLVAGEPDHVTIGHLSPEERITISRRKYGVVVTIGSDGSGGEHGTDPRLRRVGWSWAALKSCGEVVGGISGGLNGNQAQTVPRSELFAAVHFLTHVTVIGEVLVEMFIDNLYVVNALHELIAGWRPSGKTVHGDLWDLLLEDELAMSYLTYGTIRIYKIKSHLSVEQAIAAGYSRIAWEANQVADDMADKGAARAQFSPGDVRLIGQLDSAAEAVGRRLLAVGRFVAEHRTVEERTEKAKVPPLRQR